MSPEMVDRRHLSIGEVLNLLREEFPDVTISKIRFLESQGLLEPERTPSGYRKFYEADVERLRWILRQQREHFLPLKVIRGKLAAEPGGEEPVEAIKSGGKGSIAGTGASSLAEAGLVVAEEAAPSESRDTPARPARDAAVEPARRVDTSAAPVRAERPAPQWSGATGVDLTLQELANTCGLSIARVQELERFGLITGR